MFAAVVQGSKAVRPRDMHRKPENHNAEDNLCPIRRRKAKRTISYQITRKTRGHDHKRIGDMEANHEGRSRIAREAPFT
jgi:hypothetical protein